MQLDPEALAATDVLSDPVQLDDTVGTDVEDQRVEQVVLRDVERGVDRARGPVEPALRADRDAALVEVDRAELDPRSFARPVRVRDIDEPLDDQQRAGRLQAEQPEVSTSLRDADAGAFRHELEELAHRRRIGVGIERIDDAPTRPATFEAQRDRALEVIELERDDLLGADVGSEAILQGEFAGVEASVRTPGEHAEPERERDQDEEGLGRHERRRRVWSSRPRAAQPPGIHHWAARATVGNA